MAIAHSENVPSFRNDKRWPAALTSLAVGSGFFALWLRLLPQWLRFRAELVGAALWRWLAVVPSVLGFAIALRCVWDFGWTGHGTPARLSLHDVWLSSVFIGTCATPCTSVSQLGGLVCGSCLDTPIHRQLLLRLPWLWASTSSSFCTKSQPCVEHSEPITNCTART